MGAVALSLVGLTSARSFRKPLWLVALASVVVVLGLMLGVTPFDRLRELPVLRNTHFGNYYGIVLGFLLALFAAAGLEHLTQTRLSGLRAWVGISPVLLGVFAVLLTAVGWKVPSHAAYLDWHERYVVLVVMGFAAATVIFGSTGVKGNRRYAAFAGGTLVALLLVEGTWNSHFPRQERWEASDHPPPHAEFLQREPASDVFYVRELDVRELGVRLRDHPGRFIDDFQSPRMFGLDRHYARGPTPLFLRDAAQVPPEPVPTPPTSHMSPFHRTCPTSSPS